MNEQNLSERAARRRQLLVGASGGAALALSAVASPALARGTEATYPIARARYRMAANVVLLDSLVTLLPWSVTVFQDSTLDCVLEPDGKLRIGSSGLYRVSLASDWVARDRLDVDLRKVGIRRQRVGQADGPVDAIDKYHDHLASVDVPGSNAPKTVRYRGTWAPGFLAKGATASKDIVLVPPSVSNSVRLGDMALASLTQLTDEALGTEAVGALIVQAKVTGENRVRVSVHNPSIEAGVTVPSGTLNVLAMSSTAIGGDSNDAWQTLHTTSEELLAGERIYAVARSDTVGDYVQALNYTGGINKNCFLQIERLA